MTIRLIESVGSESADGIVGSSGIAYFGLGGDDSLRTAAGASNVVFVGSSGANTYTIANNSTTIVIDSNPRGTVVAPGISASQPVIGATSRGGVVNGRHVVLFDTVTGQQVVIVDGLSAVGGYVLAGQVYRPSDLTFIGGSGVAITWESLGYNTAEVEEAISFYKSRNYAAPMLVVNDSSAVWNQDRKSTRLNSSH